MSSNVANVLSRYPAGLLTAQENDTRRIMFHADLITRLAGAHGRCMDVGGGVGFLSPLLASRGISQTLVDDFSDSVNSKFPIQSLDVFAHYRVEVIDVDASSEAFAPPKDTFDVISTFDSIEHWHRSPKRSLHRMVDALKRGGYLIIGVPNCVNLRRRITVPFGLGKWSSMDDWYEQSVFRGHVREADVDDLRYIAHDLGLSETNIFGRNWHAYSSTNNVIRSLSSLVDRPLRAFPSLCSDIYLTGRKP